jgi:dUTP pyrophosphatase
MDLFELYEQALKLQERLNTTDGDVDYDQLFNEFGIDMKEIEKEMMENKTKLPLYFKKLNTDVETPSYNYESDSGFDLYSTEEITIPPFGRALIPTGLSFDIKDGYEIQVRSKSGLAINQGLFVLNSPGTVDNGYLGEVKVILFNTNQTEFVVKKGMKVGQAVLCPVVNGKWVDLINKEELSSKDRGDNGFGSTGIF